MKYKRWIPDTLLHRRVSLSSVQDDIEGLRFIFCLHETPEKYFRLMVKEPHSYRITSESLTLNYPPIKIENTDMKILFFQLEDSDYLKWIQNISSYAYKDSRFVIFKHFVFCTDNRTIDLISNDDPIFDWLSSPPKR